MVRFCSIVSCENNRGTTDDRIAMFRENYRKPWKEALNKLGLQYAGSVSSNIIVCMLHFHPDDIHKKRKTLRPGAVPSIRTRPFDPLWQTRDTTIEIEPFDGGAQLSVNRGPMIKVNESIASVSYSSRNDCNLRKCTVGNDDAMFENHNAMTKSNTFTEYPASSKEPQQLDEEYRKSRTYSKLNSPRPFQESFGKICAICLTSMPQQEFGQHLCLNQVNIECEYCVDATFTSTLALRKHLSDTDHAQLVFYKCAKCSLAFPMRKLLEIHEKTNRTHFDGVSDDLGASAMEKIFGCRRCNFSTSTAQELQSHVKTCLPIQPKLLTFPKVQLSTIPCSACSPETPSTNSQALSRPINSLAPLTLSSPPGQSKLPKLPKPPKTPRVRVRKPPPQRFFECYICKCQLENRGEARQHLNRHVAAQNTICAFCRQRYTLNELRQWHICGTNDIQFRQISCEYCDESFQSLAKCMEHLATVHADDQTMYRCRKCPRYFGMLELRDFHEKYFPHRGLGLFKCKLCTNTFGRKSSLRKHMTCAHSVEDSSKYKFLCAECGKGFRCRDKLKKHSVSHAERLIKCPDCPAKFRSKYGLEQHYQIHQNFKYKCIECNTICSTKRALEKHINHAHRKRIAEKRFKCSYCDFKFQSSEKLRRHLRTHTDERQFGCEYCPGRFFRYKGDLTKHLQTHVGDNIYKCDVCGQGFRYHTEFRRHSFAHYKQDKEKGIEATQRSSDADQTT